MPDRPATPPGFGTLWTTVALDLLGFGIVIPLLPVYAREFDASAAEVGLLLALYSAAQLVMAPVLGRISDRRGRRPVLVVSLIGSSIGSFLTGLAGSLWLLYLARILDGASGGSIGTAQAAVADLAEPDERPRLYGYLGAAFGLGFIGGPALGGLLGMVDIRLPFLVAGSLAAVNAVATARRFPETRPVRDDEEAERPRLRDVARTARTWVAVAFVAGVAFSGFEATFALLTEERLGLGVTGVGLTFAGIGVLLVIAQTRIVGPVAARLGARGALRAGLAGVAFGLVLLAVAESWAVFVPALVALTLGQSLVGPSATTLLSEEVSVEGRGAALGVQQSASALSRVVGPAIAGLTWTQLAPAAPFVLGAVLVTATWALIPEAPTHEEAHP